MHNSTRNPFTTVRTEGALLPIDLLQRIVAGDSALGGLDPESYHLAGSEKLNEAINRSWNRLLGAWATFQTARGRLGEGDPQSGGSAGTTLTRERWLMPLFQELGYGRLQAAKAVTLDGKEYRVSHTWGETPIHLVGCGVNLERRQPGVTGAAKSSPHSLVQEYLNRNPNQLWGLLSNGLTLRVLRDNASLTRQAYLEFDLEAMLTGEVYADFVVLWLTCHQSRIECPDQKPESCWLEVWSKAAQEQGTRALDKLRDGVEQAITALGGGFLAHPGNSALKARLRSGELTREGYYRQLLRLVYRLIFLFASEDRDLLLDPRSSPAARDRYLRYYSATHLRHLAENSRGGRHPDLYATLRLVSAMLGGREPTGTGAKGLGLPVLGSFLFSAEALPDLEFANLENGALLSAVRGLAFILDGNTRRAVDYRNLGTRELGSVYESLLELHPLIHIDAGTFELITTAGNERKTTGSYYTAEDLIKVLLDSALDPVILQAIQRAGPSIAAQIAALLALKVCDPACGSGHFLIAAARRIARRLAQLRSGDEEPSPEVIRTALREVIQHCVYGVDINPMSVELCKVNLWLESIEPGKPLSFLDAHIRCGNSLVGMGPKMQVSELEVPDEAFNPVTGDHKPTAALLKKRNKQEREGQESLFVTVLKTREDLDAWLAERARALEAMPEDSAAEVQAKSEAYQQVSASAEYRRQHQIADLWTAAFFWYIKEPVGKAFEIIAPTHGQFRRLRGGGATQTGLLEKVEKIRELLNFFHWPLEFADVAKQGGFDCILGNPPWERLNLEARQFFALSRPDIASAPTQTRNNLIDKLIHSDPTLYQAYQQALYSAEAEIRWYQHCSRYAFLYQARVNTYSLFVHLLLQLQSKTARGSFIVPSGIATDDTSRLLFRYLVQAKRLVSLFDFENRKKLFPAVHSSYRFCLLTTTGSENLSIQADYVFFATDTGQVKEESRHFSLTTEQLHSLNPITGLCPTFRDKRDYQLTLKIYTQTPAFITQKESTASWPNSDFLIMFRSDSSSSLYKTYDELKTDSKHFMEGHSIFAFDTQYLPVMEAKLIHQFDHRYSTYEGVERADIDSGKPRTMTVTEKQHLFLTKPRYWAPLEEITRILEMRDYKFAWTMGYRDITNATNERTAIASVLPFCGAAQPMNLFLAESPRHAVSWLSAMNSIVVDYIARQFIGGVHLNITSCRQLPIFLLSEGGPDYLFVAPRILELVYTAHDLKSFAQDMGYFGEPFPWDEDRRALLRAELDAYYARLYGLTRDELRYILDPQDVYGPDFPGETFRVLKEKEIRLFGEYRTRRLVLEAWDRLEGVTPAPVSMSGPTVAAPAPALAPVPEKFVVEEKVPQPALEAQPMLSDFGLYKCGICGKMVMGFEKENHQNAKHGRKSVEWKKIG